MFAFLLPQRPALQNGQPEGLLRFSSGDETSSPLLPSALLLPGAVEGVSGTTASQRGAQRRDVSGCGAAHQISPPRPSSPLAPSTTQEPPLAPACSRASSLAAFATSEERKMGQGKGNNILNMVPSNEAGGDQTALQERAGAGSLARGFPATRVISRGKASSILAGASTISWGQRAAFNSSRKKPGERSCNLDSFSVFAYGVLTVKGLVETSAAQAVPAMLLYKYVLCINMHLNPCLDSNLSVHPAVE